jgi:hypothetical protein
MHSSVNHLYRAVQYSRTPWTLYKTSDPGKCPVT